MMHALYFYGLFLLFSSYAFGQELACNGYSALCDRKYNEVAYAATHNGQSHRESEVHNQDMPLSEQLKQGIRATKLHVWPYENDQGAIVPFACHGVDKQILYSITMENILEQIPSLFRSYVKEQLQKISPMKDLMYDALYMAYGKGTDKGSIPFKHCIFDPARRPLVTVLSDVAQFLAENPHEVVTVILEDHTDDLAALMKDVRAAGLDAYLHVQSIDKEWPTLREMVTANKRLVLFVHGQPSLAYDQYPGLHFLWDFAWDTSWEFATVCDLKNGVKDSMPKRGQKAFAERAQPPKNKIFIVHHFVTPLMGGCKAAAKKANKAGQLRSRVTKLAQEARHIPNIIQVDFFEYPNNDIFTVVDEINGVGSYHGAAACHFK